MKPVGAGHVYRGPADADRGGPGVAQERTRVAGDASGRRIPAGWAVPPGAVAAVFIQRLFTSYLPPIWGWFTLVWMRKREYL